MTRMGLYFRTGFLLLLILVLSTAPAFANSARTHWQGTDATEAIVTDEDFLIVVEKELLTFDSGQSGRLLP